jgi:hypothetical protein
MSQVLSRVNFNSFKQPNGRKKTKKMRHALFLILQLKSIIFLGYLKMMSDIRTKVYEIMTRIHKHFHLGSIRLVVIVIKTSCRFRDNEEWLWYCHPYQRIVTNTPKPERLFICIIVRVKKEIIGYTCHKTAKSINVKIVVIQKSFANFAYVYIIFWIHFLRKDYYNC